MEFPTHIVAVSGLIRNAEGKVLLMEHPRRGWEYPGGQVEVGENLVQALEREVEEETGIIVRVGSLVGVYSNTQEGVQLDGVSRMPTKVIMSFLGEQVSGSLRTSEESLRVGWFQEEEALELCTHPVTSVRLRHMLEFNGNVVYEAYQTKPYEVHMSRKV
jgi:8-oxo-dGTP diphosphatase